MRKKVGDSQVESIQCSSWVEITEWLDGFPLLETSIDYESGFAAKAWVFRGLKSSSYELQPSIEREARDKTMEWAALEELVLSEYKARARMHLSAPLIPSDEVSWLAQMQHYAIPTRLLDFTYSPFVALYFAIRDGHQESGRTHLRLWAVDAEAVNNRFKLVAWKAARAAKERGGKRFSAVSLDPDYFYTDRDSVTTDIQELHELINGSLSATKKRRGELNRSGCVCATAPPAFNPRLASQQGLFLLNCAENLSFSASLAKMMEGSGGWCKIIDIPVGLIPEIEGRLFQMNVHEQSLFPDMEGLAGLVRQKLRLHWK
ncbi:MAG: hypothetical protein QOH06_3752 [Acidobacteriota bacterium]|jgi:hypothetical protein|nr:hypothetical protein [Acidobacteriota bacterium]